MAQPFVAAKESHAVIYGFMSIFHQVWPIICLKTILNWLNTQMVCMTFLAQDIECKDSFECADGLVCRNDKCEEGKI